MMRKYLPIIIPVICALLVLTFGYFYIQSGKNIPVVPSEVPSTLPDKNRIENLEDSVSLLISELKDLKFSIATASPETQNSVSSDYKIKTLETSVLDLKARVSALEKPVTLPTQTSTTSKSPSYIPLGASGGPWLYADWTSLNEYQISVNPDDYSGYSGMQLEVNFRIVGAPGTGYVRLYNVTDSSAVASEISTTNTSFGVLTSAAFKLTSGQKLYTIQAKSTSSQDLYIQSARIKVSF